ncbi:hypothetical protein ACLOJK_012989 [Asimina triloba]
MGEEEQASRSAVGMACTAGVEVKVAANAILGQRSKAGEWVCRRHNWVDSTLQRAVKAVQWSRYSIVGRQSRNSESKMDDVVVFVVIWAGADHDSVAMRTGSRNESNGIILDNQSNLSLSSYMYAVLDGFLREERSVGCLEKEGGEPEGGRQVVVGVHSHACVVSMAVFWVQEEEKLRREGLGGNEVALLAFGWLLCCASNTGNVQQGKAPPAMCIESNIGSVRQGKAPPAMCIPTSNVHRVQHWECSTGEGPTSNIKHQPSSHLLLGLCVGVHFVEWEHQLGWENVGVHLLNGGGLGHFSFFLCRQKLEIEFRFQDSLLPKAFVTQRKWSWLLILQFAWWGGDSSRQAEMGGNCHKSSSTRATSGFGILHRLKPTMGNYILMLGTSVMIPSTLVSLMGGSNGDKARVIQTLLFVAGLKTLLQTLFGTRLPTIIGGSYAFVIPVLSIISDPSLRQISHDHEIFQSSQHGTGDVLAWFRAIGPWIPCCEYSSSTLGWLILQLLEYVIASPVQTTFSSNAFDDEHDFVTPLHVGKCVEIGIPMLLLLVGLCLYLKHIRIWKDTPVFERFSILLSIVIIWIYAHLLTVGGAYRHAPERTKDHCRTDRAHLISSAPWFKFPYPLQWGAPTFNAGHSFAMMAAVIVSQIESTGAYIAASRFAMATPPPAYVLSRGIGWQGIGVLLDGLFGTSTGSTVSMENVGLLGISRVGSRRIVQVSAGFMVFFSVLGKFGALYASIPFPIFAAIYCVLFGLIASLGLSFLQFTNMNCMRNLFITGLSLFLGLSVPQYFNQFWASSGHGPVNTGARWFDGFLNTVFSSAPTVGFIVAVLLDNTVDVEASKKDRGMPWWVKFRNFGGDTRNEEFYTLPFNLNRFFPPT